ncbi:MAG: hypothetical protein R2932_56950 [Caldilineaceae bacterium]
MEAVAKQGLTTIQQERIESSSIPKQLRIAVCVPEIEPLQNVMAGKPADATYILQRYIINGLKARAHRLDFLAKRDLTNNVYTNDRSNRP